MKFYKLIILLFLSNIIYAQNTWYKIAQLKNENGKITAYNPNGKVAFQLNCKDMIWYEQQDTKIGIWDYQGTLTSRIIVDNTIISPAFANLKDSLSLWQSLCSTTTPTPSPNAGDSLIAGKIDSLILATKKFDTSQIDTSLINYIGQLDSIIYYLKNSSSEDTTTHKYLDSILHRQDTICLPPILQVNDSSIYKLISNIITICEDTAIRVKVICDTCRDVEHTPICIQLTAPIIKKLSKDKKSGGGVPSKSISGNVGDILQATLVSYYDCKSSAKVGIDSIFYAGQNVTVGYNFTIISCPLPQEAIPEYVQFGDPICWYRDSSGTVTFYTEIRSKNTTDNNDVISTFLLEPNGSIVLDTTGLNLIACPNGTYTTTIECFDVLITTNELNAGSEVRITCITNTINSTTKCDTTVNGIVTDLSAYLIQIGDTFGLCGSYIAPIDTLIVKTIDSTYYKQLDSIKLLLIQLKDTLINTNVLLTNIHNEVKKDCIGSNETYYINGTNTISINSSEVCSYTITVIEDNVIYTENSVTSPFDLPVGYSGTASFKNGANYLINSVSFTGTTANSKAIIKVIK